MKYGTLNARKKNREKAQQKLDTISEDIDNNNEERIKQFKKTVIITKSHMNECKKLLNIMGIPYIDSLGEADAQCAELVKSGQAYAVCSEDMDILTFGSTRILRKMSLSKNRPIYEINLENVLCELDITFDQFIDLCILLGCDYCDTIKGVGRIKALQLIKSIGTLDGIIKTEKYKMPNNFPYNEAKNYFLNPNVINTQNMKFNWTNADNKTVLKLMCDKYNFNHSIIKRKLNTYQHYYKINKY